MIRGLPVHDVRIYNRSGRVEQFEIRGRDINDLEARVFARVDMHPAGVYTVIVTTMEKPYRSVIACKRTVR